MENLVNVNKELDFLCNQLRFALKDFRVVSAYEEKKFHNQNKWKNFSKTVYKK